MKETQVLMVGAGPVGLTLAIDLGQRGVEVVLIERNPNPLLRPDLHIAWRGNTLPADSQAVAATITGQTIQIN